MGLTEIGDMGLTEIGDDGVIVIEDEGIDDISFQVCIKVTDIDWDDIICFGDRRDAEGLADDIKPGIIQAYQDGYNMAMRKIREKLSELGLEDI